MNDYDYMKRAIDLASRGRGLTNPNPMVGAVIVKDGRIIGEGWHQRCGGLHAERNAFASLTESAQGADLYVTLEPCCHYGRTPPCTEAILAHGIRRVVIGSRDPNPRVAGKGARLLREAGVTVEEDFMRSECDRLNPVFFHYITTGTPYVVMKYAMTADGKIATKTGASRWITGKEARAEVHRMRTEYMGIMAGIGTVLADDPMLNVRTGEFLKTGGEREPLMQDVAGRADSAGAAANPAVRFEKKRDPVRIICDGSLRIPADSRICRSAKDYPTIIACASPGEEKLRQLEEMGIEVVRLPGRDGKADLKQLMRYLGERGIDSVLLEGGGELNDSMLRAGLVQEVRVFLAPKLFGGAAAKTPVGGIGVEFPDQAVKLELTDVKKTGEDLMLIYRVC